MFNNAVFYGVPGKPVVEPKPLVIKQIGNKTFYWNFQHCCWKRLTKRCPYLN